MKKLIEGQGYVIAAKNIRIELKNEYPTVKFSVVSKSYSGGDSVRVNWIDGPSQKEVEAIINKYEYGRFDGSIDLYEYNKDHSFTDKYGSTKYAFANRDHSDISIQRALDSMYSKYQANFERDGLPKPTTEDYRNGLLRSSKFQLSGGFNHDFVEREFYAILSGSELQQVA